MSANLVESSNQNDTETVNDDVTTTKESAQESSNVIPSKPKRSKESFLNRFMKRFSSSKKIKTDSDETVSSSTPKHSKNESHQNREGLGDGKENKRLSGLRLSFGKGKSSGASKGDDKKDDNKTKDLNKLNNSSHNNNRPQSMHVTSNCQPPRYGFLASFGWYWGPLSRAEATHYLRNTDNGSFLVRDSEGDPNKFTLSFKGAGHIFHNRILRHNNKYAFLPNEEFDSIPDLIDNATRRSRTSAYCFSRSADKDASGGIPAITTSGNDTTTNHVANTNDDHADNQAASNPTQTTDEVGINDGNNNNSNTPLEGSNICKHEVRLLYPVSRYKSGVRSLSYLSRFMIRQYCAMYELDKLSSLISQELISYLREPKFYI